MNIKYNTSTKSNNKKNEEIENQSKDNQNVVKRRIKKSIRDIIEQHRINTNLRKLIGKSKDTPNC